MLHKHQVYIDGVFDNTLNSVLAPNPTETAPLYIGMDTNGQPYGEYYFKGSLDEIRITIPC